MKIEECKPGLRVGLRGFGSLDGDSHEVEGCRGEIIEAYRNSGRVVVRVTRDPEMGVWDVKVYPSQCRKLKPPAPLKKLWARIEIERCENNAVVERRWVVRDMCLDVGVLKRWDWIEFVEVRKKKE